MIKWGEMVDEEKTLEQALQSLKEKLSDPGFAAALQEKTDGLVPPVNIEESVGDIKLGRNRPGLKRIEFEVPDDVFQLLNAFVNTSDHKSRAAYLRKAAQVYQMVQEMKTGAEWVLALDKGGNILVALPNSFF